MLGALIVLYGSFQLLNVMQGRPLRSVRPEEVHPYLVMGKVGIWLFVAGIIAGAVVAYRQLNRSSRF